MVICIKWKLTVFLLTCLILYIPISCATSHSWSYRIDGISVSAITQDGKNILAGSSSGLYYLFDEYGKVIGQKDLNGEITSVDINDECVILGTKSTSPATFIFSLSGRKILHSASDPVLSVAISENSSFAISGTEKYIHRFPSLGEGKVLRVGTPVNYVSISANGKKAAAATTDEIYVFNNDTDQYLKHPISSTTSMQFLDEFLIVGTEEGLLYLITETGGWGYVQGTGAKLIGDLGGAVVSIEVGTEVFVVGTSKGDIYLFNKEGKKIRNFSINEELVDCDMSSDGKFITAASSQNLYMFDENGKILWQKNVGGIKIVEMSADGRNMVVIADNTFLFLSNWQYMFNGDNHYPYSSRQEYSFKDFRNVWTYPVSSVGEIYTEEPYIKIGVGDVNGDGKNEIVASSGRNLVVLNPEKKVLWKKVYTKDVIGVTLMDVNNDTVPEVVYSLRDGRYNLFVLDVKKNEIIEFDFMDYFRPSIVGDEEAEVSMIPVVSYDIDDDSRTEILAVVNAGYSLKPRGILAFEYPSKKVEWFYETGPLVTFEAFCDIDQDSKPEIILGSRSPCNGNRVREQDDCHVYLTVLSCNGREIWSKEISEGFKVLRVGVEDINDDSGMEIVGTVSSAGNTYGRLFVMDNKGEVLYDHEFKYSLWLGGIADFNNDRSLEIVATDSEGSVNIYSSSLELIKKYMIGEYLRSEVGGINDMDGDGENEIILEVWDRSVVKLIVLNSDLEEEEWSKKFGYFGSILVTNVSGCGNDILIVADGLQLFSFENEGEYLCTLSIPLITETPEPTSPPTETPEPTSPPTETPPSATLPPTTPPPTTSPPITPSDGWSTLQKIAAVCSIAGFILAIIGIINQRTKKRTKKVKTPSKEINVKKVVGSGPSKTDFEFDIAISFAGEDREIAEELAGKLKAKDIKVFYDRFYKGELWGKELTKYFQEVYGPKTRFVVLLLSKHYPVKKWTDFEFFIMREEAKKRKTEFILPIRLDDTKMEGIREDVAYLDFQKEQIDGIADCLVEKLSKPIDQGLSKESEE